MRDGQRGVALITVLGFLAVMSLICIGIVGASRTTVGAAQRHLARLQAQAAIESAIDIAAMELVTARGSVPEILSGARIVEAGGFRVVVTVRNERGKIDINRAPLQMLAALFREAGASPDRAIALASAVEDWRDGDDLVRVNGAEARQYADAGLGYGPANRFFTSVEELRLVLGMAGKVFDCVRPELTVLTQAQGADIAAATPMVRRALGMGAQAETGGSMALLGRSPLSPGDVFEITARLEDAGRTLRRSERTAIRITGNPDEPWWVLSMEPAQGVDDAARRACPVVAGRDGRAAG